MYCEKLVEVIVSRKVDVCGLPAIVCIDISFLSKIQNRTCEKTEKKILLLSCKKLVKTQFLGVVVFPSNF